MARSGSPKKPANGRRKPKQARSRALVDAVVTATAQILREAGPEAASTNRVAERAGVSIGSLYQYFPDKQALFTAVAERHVEAMELELGRQLGALATVAVEDLVRTAIVGFFRVVEVDAPLHAQLQRLSLWGLTSSVMQDYLRRMEVRFGDLMAARRHELPLPPRDPHLTARVVLRAVGGIVDGWLIEDPTSIADPRLLDEIIHIFDSALGFPPNPSVVGPAG